MRRRTAWVMATAGGLVIANNHYNQPLLEGFTLHHGPGRNDRD